MLNELTKELYERVINKYGSPWKASKVTGLDRSYITNLIKRPSWSNFFRVAEVCGFQIEVRFINAEI